MVRVLICSFVACRDIFEVSARTPTLYEEDDSLIQVRSSSFGALNSPSECPVSDVCLGAFRMGERVQDKWQTSWGRRADGDPWLRDPSGMGSVLTCSVPGDSRPSMDTCQDLVHTSWGRLAGLPWGNGHGWSCATYEEHYCKNGVVIPGKEWAMGHKFNYPETSCCACGKGTTDGDTPNWGNGQYGNPGLSCAIYEANFCEYNGAVYNGIYNRGRFRSGMEWASGAKFKYPELNCVGCGKFRYGCGSPITHHLPSFNLEQLAPMNDTEFDEIVKNPDGKDASKDTGTTDATDEMDEFAMNAGGEIEATVVAWKLANMEADKVSR